jgi:RNA polymerase subunit RPABC4/transcription elongation factor Spt4
MNVAFKTCPQCEAAVTVECRVCGNTIETETEACPACKSTEYEAFLLD